MKNFKKIICTVAVLIFFIVSVDVMASNSSIVDNDEAVTSSKKENVMSERAPENMFLDVEFERADEKGALYKVFWGEYYLTDNGAYKVSINGNLFGQLIEIDKSKIIVEVDTMDNYVKDAISYDYENGILNIENISNESSIEKKVDIKFIYENVTKEIRVNLCLGKLIVYQPKDIQGNDYRGVYTEVTRYSSEYDSDETREEDKYGEYKNMILQIREIDKYSYFNLLLITRDGAMGSSVLINLKEKIKSATLENGVYNIGDIRFQEPNIIINSYGIDGETPNTKGQFYIEIKHNNQKFAKDLTIHSKLNEQLILGDLGSDIWVNDEERKISLQTLGEGNIVGSSEKITIDYDPNNVQTVNLVERVTGIKGNIRGENGELINGSTDVTLFDLEGNKLSYIGNNEASYVFKGLEVGKEYEVIAGINRNSPFYMIDGLPEEIKYYTKSKPYRFTYTGEPEIKDLVLEYAQIQGEIFTKDTNENISTDVTLITPSGKVIEVETDCNTSFYAIGGFELEEGEYTLKVEVPFYEPYEEKFTLPLPNSNEGTLALRNKKDVYLTKIPALTVSLSHEDGSAFMGVCKLIIATDDEVIEDITYGGSDEKWELKKGKEYTVSIYPYRNSEVFSIPYTFVCEGEDVNLKIDLIPPVIKGAIKSSDTEEWIEAEVSIILPNGEQVIGHIKDGAYLIGGFEPVEGEYTIKAVVRDKDNNISKDYEPYEAKIQIGKENEFPINHEIVIQKNPKLTVNILDKNGNECMKITRISIVTDDEVLDDIVNPLFSTEWELKKGKEYTVTIYPYGNSETFSKPYTFVCDGKDVNLKMKLTSPVVKGTIKNSITEELMEAEVSIILPNGENITAYGEDGNYVIGGFEPIEGEYTIQAVVRDADKNISKYYEPYEAKIHIGKDYKLPIIHEIVMQKKPAGAIKEYDVNKDGLIDIKDVEALFEYVNLKEGHANFDPSYDYNDDKIIDIYDFIKININEIGLTATVKQQTISSKLSISLINAPSNITKYQAFDGETALGRIALINEEVVIFPQKYPGDKITIKLMNDKGEVVKVIEVTIK